MTCVYDYLFLTPTLRPADRGFPVHGGVYVHRWFEVEAGAADEFISLRAGLGAI